MARVKKKYNVPEGSMENKQYRYFSFIVKILKLEPSENIGQQTAFCIIK